MTEGGAPTRAEDAWERHRWVWTAGLLGLVGIGATAALSDPETGSRPRLLAVALSLAFAAWYLVGSRLAALCRSTEQKSGDHPTVAFCIGLIALWTGLALTHPAFFLVLFALYGQLWARLPTRAAIATSGLLSFAAMAMQVSHASGPLADQIPFLIISLVGSAFGVLMGLWITAIIEQSQQRQALIEELERTRADLATAEREAGVLQERQRLAAEIHDTLAQGFTSIVMVAQAAEAGLPATTSTATREQLELIGHTARENLTEARRLVTDLGPASLAETSLADAVRRLADRFHTETGIEARCTVTGDAQRMAPANEVVVLRAAQEALANVRKHARATAVELELAYSGGGVTLEVRDDGVGFDLRTPARGFGLRGMRQRLEPLGGRVAVDSTPGQGTTVTVALS